MTIKTLLLMMALAVPASDAGQPAAAGPDFVALSTRLEKASLNDDAAEYQAALALAPGSTRVKRLIAQGK